MLRQVCEGDWAHSNGLDEALDQGEWSFSVDVIVVDQNFNTRPRDAVVYELEEQAKRAPAGKRKQEQGEEDDGDHEGPAAKKAVWRKCATCGK